MEKNVIPFKGKLNYKKFAELYPRANSNSSLSPVPLDDPRLEYVMPIDGYRYCERIPEPGYSVAAELDLGASLPDFNQVLIYRIFLLLYGDPDVNSAYVSQEKRSAIPKDWAFRFSLPDQMVGELCNRYMSMIYLVFFEPSGPASESIKKARAESMTRCLEELKKTVVENLHLWDEKSELRAYQGPIAVSNIFSARYKGAESLLSAARHLDEPIERGPHKYGESLLLPPVGFMYLSAAIFFFMGFEAFINALYHFLIRDEFKDDKTLYDRLLIRGDLDLRVKALHIFCNGFRHSPVGPGSELWTQLMKLRDFRNNVIHGNVTEDHRYYSFQEGRYFFFYSPGGDFRGNKFKDSGSPRISTFQARINESSVLDVKQIVDAVRAAIVEAMDSETKAWATSWLWEAIISPRGMASNETPSAPRSEKSQT